MILEVDTHVEHQSSIVRGIKGIVADIGKPDVIGQVGIKHIIPDAASQSQSSVCASEIAVRERVLRLTVFKVSDGENHIVSNLYMLVFHPSIIRKGCKHVNNMLATPKQRFYFITFLPSIMYMPCFKP